MPLVHKAKEVSLKSGDQICARCKTALHHVEPSLFTVDGKPDALLAASSGFSTEVEVCLTPLQFFDVGTALEEGYERCAAEAQSPTVLEKRSK